jgi:hypothetical protein
MELATNMLHKKSASNHYMSLEMHNKKIQLNTMYLYTINTMIVYWRHKLVHLDTCT